MFASFGERHEDGRLRWFPRDFENLTQIKRAAKYREREVFYTTSGTEHGPYGGEVTMWVWDDTRWVCA